MGVTHWLWLRLACWGLLPLPLLQRLLVGGRAALLQPHQAACLQVGADQLRRGPFWGPSRRPHPTTCHPP